MHDHSLLSCRMCTHQRVSLRTQHVNFRVVVVQAQEDFETRKRDDARLSGVECMTIHACALRNLVKRNVQVDPMWKDLADPEDLRT